MSLALFKTNSIVPIQYVRKAITVERLNNWIIKILKNITNANEGAGIDSDEIYVQRTSRNTNIP